MDADKGIIVTNNHVVEGADEVEVALPDGRKLEAAVLGADPKSDLAVLQLADPALGFGGAAYRHIGRSPPRRSRAGHRQPPFGVGQTVTMGIVSATGRADVGIVDYEDFIQTDAAINPGNSGGALVNMRGELVGVNTAIISRSGGYQGIGFAIPTQMVSPIVDSILDDGTVQRGFLGVRMQEVNDELAEMLGLGDAVGVLVSDVVSGSPAEQAGLQRGDVIVSFGGDVVDSMSHFRNRVAGMGPDQPFRLEVLRDGKRKKLKGTLGLLDSDGQPAAAAPAQGADPARGLQLEPLTPRARSRVGVPVGIEGVLVVGVQPDSPAAQAGLRPGDVLLEIGRNDVEAPSEVNDLPESQRERARPHLPRRRYPVRGDSRPGVGSARAYSTTTGMARVIGSVPPRPPTVRVERPTRRSFFVFEGPDVAAVGAGAHRAAPREGQRPTLIVAHKPSESPQAGER